MKQSNSPLRILLPEGSSNSARQSLYGLGNKYVNDIVDPSPWCQCRFSSLVHNWIRCPQVAKDPLGYARFVAKRVKQNHYDVLFPTHEQVYVFSRFRELFGKNVAIAVPSFDAIQRVQSKACFSRLKNDLQLPTPATQIACSRTELFAHDEFPFYLKLAHSTASLGVIQVRNRDELRKNLDRFEKLGAWREGDELVVQQPAAGRQSEVSSVFQDGRLVGFACADVLATGIGGGPALRRSALHPPVVEHLRRLGSHLRWNGPISLEHFYDADTHQQFYIEANPRIGETLNAQISGVNLCEATVRIAMGEQVESLPEAKTTTSSPDSSLLRFHGA